MRSVQVYQPHALTGELEMKFVQQTPSEISGVQVLLQNIAMFIRTKPGTDSFNPDRGTSLGDTGLMAIAINNPDQIRVLVSDSIEKTQTFIINQQETQKSLGQYIPPESTLVKLELNNIYQGDDPSSIFIEILVYTEGNQQYFLTV